MEDVLFEFTPMILVAVSNLGYSLLKVALILIGGYLLISILLKIVRKFLNKSTLDASLHTFIVNSLKTILWIILAVTIFGVVGIPTSTFVAVLGAAGAAIALALKDSLGNVAGGIIILVTKPFKQGDYIDITEIAGSVEHIDLLYTTLKTADNKVVSVPNGKITTAVMINYSKEATRRVDCRFSVGHDEDIARVKRILINVANDNEHILNDPAPFVGVSGYGEKAVEMELKVWCNTDKYWEVKYFLEENVKIAFDEEKIRRPFAQISVDNKK